MQQYPSILNHFYPAMHILAFLGYCLLFVCLVFFFPNPFHIFGCCYGICVISMAKKSVLLSLIPFTSINRQTYLPRLQVTLLFVHLAMFIRHIVLPASFSVSPSVLRSITVKTRTASNNGSRASSSLQLS